MTQSVDRARKRIDENEARLYISAKLGLSGADADVEMASFRQLVIRAEEEDQSLQAYLFHVLRGYMRESCMKFSFLVGDTGWKIDALKLKNDAHTAEEEFPPDALFWQLEEVLARSSSSEKFDTTLYPLSDAQGSRLPRQAAHKISRLELSGYGYQFGIHRFHAARAVIDILRTIEERYDVDFSELEQNRDTRTAKKATSKGRQT